jgi:hypothetical protein
MSVPIKNPANVIGANMMYNNNIQKQQQQQQQQQQQHTNGISIIIIIIIIITIIIIIIIIIIIAVNHSGHKDDSSDSDEDYDEAANTAANTADTAANTAATKAGKILGKQLGSKGWGPAENVALFGALGELKITCNEGEKDPCWQSLVTLLKEKMSASTARPVGATREHAKDMIQHCRTMSSCYSFLTAQDQELPRCPVSTDDHFDESFSDYCTNLWTMWDKQSLDEKKKSISKFTAKWWDSSPCW